MRFVVVLALAAGCNAVFGLEPTRTAVTPDAAVADADPGAVDAGGPSHDAGPCLPVDDGLDCTDDVCLEGVPEHLPIGRGEPCAEGYCDGAGACVECVEDAQCGVMPPGQCADVPRCLDDACGLGPAPRNTLCNSQMDQCDGAGACVDCTNSGGCDECCACFDQVCLPV